MCDNFNIQRHGLRLTSNCLSPQQLNSLDRTSYRPHRSQSLEKLTKDFQAERCQSPWKSTHFHLSSEYHVAPHVHGKARIENFLQCSTSSHLLQVIFGPHLNPIGILQNHPNLTVSDFVNPTSIGLEARNSPCEQPLQPNPNEDSQLEM